MVFHMYYCHYIILILLWQIYQIISIMAILSIISWPLVLQVICLLITYIWQLFRAIMRPGNHEVFQRSFAEGNAPLPPSPPSLVDLPLMLPHAALQSWMESRFWIFTGLIRLMPWKDLSQSWSTMASCTQLSSLAHQSFTQMIVPWPILAWYFRPHVLWIPKVLHFLLCSMLMPPFPGKACHIIPYTVRIFLLLCALWSLYQ